LSQYGALEESAFIKGDFENEHSAIVSTRMISKKFSSRSIITLETRKSRFPAKERLFMKIINLGFKTIICSKTRQIIDWISMKGKETLKNKD